MTATSETQYIEEMLPFLKMPEHRFVLLSHAGVVLISWVLISLYIFASLFFPLF